MDDAKLQALFESDAPPAHDPAFILSVLKRIEQKQMRMQTGLMAMYAIAAAALLYALSPVLALFGPDAVNIVLLAAFTLVSLYLLRRELPGAQYLFPV
jgi:hypothetical protein